MLFPRTNEMKGHLQESLAHEVKYVRGSHDEVYIGMEEAEESFTGQDKNSKGGSGKASGWIQIMIEG